MRLASLGSGSQGNATLVQSDRTCVMIDCGFSLNQFNRRLERLDVAPEAIDAIWVTHEHADHGSGVAKVAERFGIPLWMTVGTARLLGIENFQPIHGGQTYQLLDLEIDAVTVPHDAAEPVQFVIKDQNSGRRLGILTDSGHVSEHMRQVYQNVDGLLLEFNYDPEMLRAGPYPPRLKQRVGGNHGHLSNPQSIDLLQQVQATGLDCLVAAHISQKNNSPAIVSEMLRDIGFQGRQVIACQDQGFGWIEI